MLQSVLCASTRSCAVRAAWRALQEKPAKQRLAPALSRISTRSHLLAFSTSRVLQRDGDEEVQDEPRERRETPVSRQQTSEPRPMDTVYIGNLPYDTTGQDLREYLAEFPGIKDLRIAVGSDALPRGYGHLLFDSPENAKELVNAHNSRPMVFFGRRLVVELSQREMFGGGGKRTGRMMLGQQQPTSPPSTTIFVGNTTLNVQEADLRRLFEPYGELVAVRIARNDDGSGKGFAHVDFASVDSAQALVNAALEDPFYLFGRALRLDYAPGYRASLSIPSRRLYFRGWRGSPQELMKGLQEAGCDPIHVNPLRDVGTKRIISAGFIEFATTEDAIAAKEKMAGAVIAGVPEPLELDFARTKTVEAVVGIRRKHGQLEVVGEGGRGGR